MSRSARTSTSEDVGADGGKYKLNEVVICDYRDMLYTAKVRWLPGRGHLVGTWGAMCAGVMRRPCH